MGDWKIVEPRRFKPKLKQARRMRSEPSSGEAILWRLLRGGRLEGAKFRRQMPVGPYIVDFVCLAKRLVVEVDGYFHDPVKDTVRDAFLVEQGFRILRIEANRLHSIPELVVQDIEAALPFPHLERTPSPHAGEGREQA